MFSSHSISIFSSVCGWFSLCKTHCCCVWVVAETLNLLLTPTFRPLTNSQQLGGVNLCTLARRLRTNTLYAHVLSDRTSKTFEANLLASWIKKMKCFSLHFQFPLPSETPENYSDVFAVYNLLYIQVSHNMSVVDGAVVTRLCVKWRHEENGFFFAEDIFRVRKHRPTTTARTK